MRAFNVRAEWLYKGRYPKTYTCTVTGSSMPVAVAKAGRAWKVAGLAPREVCKQVKLTITTS